MDQKVLGRKYYFGIVWFFILIFALESGYRIYDNTFGLYFLEIPFSWKIRLLTDPLFYIEQIFSFLQLLMPYFLFKNSKFIMIQIFLSCGYAIISFLNILIAVFYAVGYLQFSPFDETLFFPRSKLESLFHSIFLFVNIFIILILIRFFREIRKNLV
ncbi:MAG: hypothetical protein KBA66_05355 [Leptospiraceae bacterium]|nr:hypothetical protein [Leptospiraceae bacterium]